MKKWTMDFHTWQRLQPQGWYENLQHSTDPYGDYMRELLAYQDVLETLGSDITHCEDVNVYKLAKTRRTLQRIAFIGHHPTLYLMEDTTQELISFSKSIGMVLDEFDEMRDARVWDQKYVMEVVYKGCAYQAVADKIDRQEKEKWQKHKQLTK